MDEYIQSIAAFYGVDIDCLVQLIKDKESDWNDIFSTLREIQQERRERLIEEVEERQHQSGFYAFQDLMDNWRNER